MFTEIKLFENTSNYFYTSSFRKNDFFDLPLNHQSLLSYEKEEKIFEKFYDFILNGDIEGIKNTEELKIIINYRDVQKGDTLLHLAYSFNKPIIVEFLLKNGADPEIINRDSKIPLELAHPDYVDDFSSVVNEIVQRYFKKIDYSNDSNTNNPQLLFNLIKEFIREKKWKYLDPIGNNKTMPFKDGSNLVIHGNPSLIYHVNCYDLTALFIKAARKIGLDVELITYRGGYKTIERKERKKFNINGKMKIFDGSLTSEKNFQFGQHYVVYSLGWYYDLTLMCKYQNKDAVLSPNTKELTRIFRILPNGDREMISKKKCSLYP